MTKTGVKRYSLNQQVADSLEAMIDRGFYKIGEKIPTEIELMHMFDVSRNTVREALQALNQAGVVYVKQGDGTYVRAKNRFEANMAAKYEEVSYEEISEARKSIEITICSLCAERRSKGEMTRISKAFKARSNLNKPIKELSEKDLEFHLAIAEGCHNKILADVYNSMQSYLLTHIMDRNMDNELTDEEIEEYHLKLYEAILNQDPKQAGIYAEKIVKLH